MNEPIVLGRAQGRKKTVALSCAFAMLLIASDRMVLADNKFDDNRPYDSEALRHYNRAVQLHQSGALDRAVDEYALAVRADDRMAEAWCNLGGIYMIRRKYTKALEAFDKALVLSPNQTNNRMILNSCGSALVGLGRYDDAIDKFKEVLKIDPSFTAAAENLIRTEKLKAEHQK